MTRLYEEQEPVWSSREGDSVSLFVGSKSIAISADLIQDVITNLSELYHPEVKLMDGNPQSAEEVFELFPALDGSLGEYDVACRYCSRGIMCRDTAQDVVNDVADGLIDAVALYIHREGMWLRPRGEIISEIAKKLE